METIQHIYDSKNRKIKSTVDYTEHWGSVNHYIKYIYNDDGHLIEKKYLGKPLQYHMYSIKYKLWNKFGISTKSKYRDEIIEDEYEYRYVYDWEKKDDLINHIIYNTYENSIESNTITDSKKFVYKYKFFK